MDFRSTLNLCLGGKAQEKSSAPRKQPPAIHGHESTGGRQSPRVDELTFLRLQRQIEKLRKRPVQVSPSSQAAL